jgi:hypothetical protein
MRISGLTALLLSTVLLGSPFPSLAAGSGAVFESSTDAPEETELSEREG